MKEYREYLRAYWRYVSTNVGWGKALMGALLWVAGMLAPLGTRMFVELPDWLPFTWMAGWSLCGYVFAPYGMWKHTRAQDSTAGS